MATTTKPGWAKVPRAGTILKAGNSVKHETGSWRTFRPVWHKEKCIQCFTCWVLCPDSAIRVENDKVCGVNYAFCKGCGICAAECPPKANAFDMKPESEFR